MNFLWNFEYEPYELCTFYWFSGNIFLVQTVAGGITLDPATADDQDAVQYSENAAVTGYSIRYQQSPCTGPTQS